MSGKTGEPHPVAIIVVAFAVYAIMLGALAAIAFAVHLITS